MKLTDRQREVVVLLARGQSQKQIAHEIGTKIAAVAQHIARMKRSNGATNQFQLGMMALKDGDA